MKAAKPGPYAHSELIEYMRGSYIFTTVKPPHRMNTAGAKSPCSCECYTLAPQLIQNLKRSLTQAQSVRSVTQNLGILPWVLCIGILLCEFDWDVEALAVGRKH
jgi:hypothetical protein